MKVLFLTVWYPTAENPIAGVFVREHAKAAAMYDDVVVVHLAGYREDLDARWHMDEERDEALTEGIRTYRLWHRRSPIPKTSYLLYLWATLRAFRRLSREGFRPDVIHAHVYTAGVPAVLVGKVYGIPVVVTEHFSAFARGTLGRLALWLARVAFAGSRVVMPVSGALRRAIEDNGIVAPFHVVPNAVDTTLFHPMPSPRTDGTAKKLLSVPDLQYPEIKGVGYLFAALARLRRLRDDWHLDIVGDGSGRGSCECITRELGLADRVTFRGMQSRENVASLMRRADVVVVPSLVETFSVVAAEALASGTPVVATRCGGPEEFITDEVGMLVPPGDAAALARALDHVLDHADHFSADSISRYAAERFAHEAVGARLHAVYRECIEGSIS